MENKLRQQKGETLVETLVSMMIILLTIAFLFTCVTAAENINKQTRDADKVYREQLQAAESRAGTGIPKQVTVSFAGTGLGAKTVDVKLYTEDGSNFAAYDYYDEETQ